MQYEVLHSAQYCTVLKPKDEIIQWPWIQYLAWVLLPRHSRCTALHFTSLDCTVMNCTALRCNELKGNELIELYWITLHYCSVVHFTALQPTALQFTLLINDLHWFDNTHPSGNPVMKNTHLSKAIIPVLYFPANTH